MAAKKLVVAAGLIVFRRQCQNVEYLVMKHTYGGHWGTPKGRVNTVESLMKYLPDERLLSLRKPIDYY